MVGSAAQSRFFKPIFFPSVIIGFWQTRWYDDHSLQERENLMKVLVTLIIDGKV